MLLRRCLASLTVVLVVAACHTVGVRQKEGNYAEVAPTIANQMMIDSNQVVVLDLRSAPSYKAGHIAGALSTPIDTIETRLPELLPYQGTTVLIYADEHADSVSGARLLTAAGFRNVVRISGGIRGWIERGYPTVSSQ